MTKNNEVAPTLSHILADLYRDPTHIQRLVDDLDIDLHAINFQGTVLDIWQCVLKAALQQDMFDELVQETLMAHPDQRIIIATQINTGGGAFIAGDASAGGDIVGRDQAKGQKSATKLIDPDGNTLFNQLRTWQILSERTVSKLESREGKKILPVLQKWLDRVEYIPEELKINQELQEFLQKVAHKTIEKLLGYAKSDLHSFSNGDARERKLLARLRAMIDSGLQLDEEILHQLVDLEFVLAYLFGAGTTTAHHFTDTELSGICINLAWAEVANRPDIGQEIERLQQEAADERRMFYDLLTGAVRCEQYPIGPHFKLNTLLRELADDYVTQRRSQEYQILYPWWPTMIDLIDQSAPPQSPLAVWVQRRRDEKAHWNSIKFRVDTGVTFMRALWPLPGLGRNAAAVNDANYDFPHSVEEIYEQGGHPVYRLMAVDPEKSEDRATGEAIAAAEICERYLSQPAHHLIIGRLKTGKTWLRLYLDYYVSVSFEEILPVFFFAATDLVLEIDRLAIGRTLAFSIANQLFASLLVRSGNRTSTSDPLRVQRMATIPFLRRYGYDLPSGDRSLAQPVPPAALLDIALAYGNGPLREIYMQMQQEIMQNAHISIAPPADAVEPMLKDIQNAVELAGYKNIFVTVDNWDHLPNPTRQRLLQHLLDPELLIQLQNHRIFLKIFTPNIDQQTSQQLRRTCSLERLQQGTSSRLLVYTYP